MGIVSGKWLVGSSWLKACLAEERLVPEEDHEVMVSDGSGSQSGPLLGRLHVAQGQRLLHGYQVIPPSAFPPRVFLPLALRGDSRILF